MITEWYCGGCGRRHGWECPYFGYPGESLKWSRQRQEEANRQMLDDKKHKRGVFGAWNDKRSDLGPVKPEGGTST